jgi:hypothetical protein
MEAVPAQIPRQPQDLGHVIELAQAAVDQQFQIAERLDNKARGQLAVVGTWFALVQTVAGLTAAIGKAGNGWLFAIVSLAVVGGVLIALTMFYSSKALGLKQEEEIDPDALLTLKNWAFEPNRNIDVELLLHLKALLDTRMNQNQLRAKAIDATQQFWLAAVVVTFLELIVALFAKLPIA